MDARRAGTGPSRCPQDQYQFDHSDIRAPFPGRVVARLDQSWRIRDGRQSRSSALSTQADRSERPDTDRNGRLSARGMSVTVEIEAKRATAVVRAIVPWETSQPYDRNSANAPPGTGFFATRKVFIPTAHCDVVAVPAMRSCCRGQHLHFQVGRKGWQTRAVETGSEDAHWSNQGSGLSRQRVIVRGPSGSSGSKRSGQSSLRDAKWWGKTAFLATLMVRSAYAKASRTRQRKRPANLSEGGRLT